MMRNTRFLGTLLAFFALTALSLATDIVGTWKGKIEIEVDKGAQAQLKGMAPKTPSLTLELRADKTYKAAQAGTPDGKEHTSEGTWKLEGDTLKLLPLKRDGKAAGGDGAKPRVYTLSKDGKTLSLDLAGQLQISAKGATNPKAMPRFKAKMILHRSK